MTEYWMQRKSFIEWATVRTYCIPDLKQAKEFKAECEKQTKDEYRILKVEVIG